MKGLYLFQRYLPFTDTIWLVLIRQSDGVFYLISMLNFFKGQIGEEIWCRKVHYASGGSSH